MPNPLFEGPGSLRDPGERVAFWLTLIFAFPTAFAIGFVIHEEVGIPQVALLIVFAMIYVTLARGRLLGSSVRIHEAQYPRVFSIVKRVCAALEISMPLVFVDENNRVPVAALGFGEPYSLVFSSHWIELFKDDELAFAVGRELGHIVAGHTRYHSLLSVNGQENPVVALIFGAWLRRCDLSCDRVGLLACGSLEAAIRSIAVMSFHHFGRQVDMDQFAEQALEINSDAVLRWGEWLGPEPYATKRIKWMRRFMESHSYQAAEDWFLREVNEEPPALPPPGSTHVVKADCVGIWRRLAAFSIDFALVAALIGAFGGSAVYVGHNKGTPRPVATPAMFKYTPAKEVTPASKASPDDEDSDSDSSSSNRDDDSQSDGMPFGLRWTPIDEIRAAFFPTLLTVYLIVIISVTGQTFGMMIAGLRVVTTTFKRASTWRLLWCYGVWFCLWPIIPLCGLFSRILLHDRLSGTRVVTSERIVARALIGKGNKK